MCCVMTATVLCVSESGKTIPLQHNFYRHLLTGLPPSGRWQDLKDHMREAGDVCFADVFKDGTGVVEFLRYEDMKYAVKKLDDSRFRSHEVSVKQEQVMLHTASDVCFVK